MDWTLALPSKIRNDIGECRALWGSPDVLHVSIYSSEGWAVYENGQSHDQHCWKQVCDQRGLLVAKPFSVSVSSSNVVERISMKFADLKFSVFARSTKHTHAERNEVTLVWGSLTLAPINVIHS